MAGRRGHSWSLSLSGAAAQRCCSSASRQAARRQAGRKGRVDALELIAQAAATCWCKFGTEGGTNTTVL
jgi:hypothetical protein